MSDRRRLPNKLLKRPIVGGIVVPYMVADQDPIDFKITDARRVRLCAERRRCGICGTVIPRGQPMAFIAPFVVECSADPWMHRDCAEYTITACPFVSGKRPEWRDQEFADAMQEFAKRYEQRQELVVARNGKTHLQSLKDDSVWHFLPVGIIERRVIREAVAS